MVFYLLVLKKVKEEVPVPPKNNETFRGVQKNGGYIGGSS